MSMLDDLFCELPCGRHTNIKRLSTDREVHVWRRSLNCSSTTADKMQELLVDDERQRAQRFRFARDRSQFIVRRAALRIILSRYLGAGPAEIRFNNGWQGKPRLSGEFADSELEFSITHSQGMALIAVAAGQRIGVDLECVRPLSDLDGLLSQCLSPAELRSLSAEGLGDTLNGFYRYWTCKEAHLKALGIGLACRLDSVRISFGSANGTGTAEICGDSIDSTRLFIWSFSPFSGYFAAAAFTHRDSRLRCFGF